MITLVQATRNATGNDGITHEFAPNALHLCSCDKPAHCPLGLYRKETATLDVYLTELRRCMSAQWMTWHVSVRKGCAFPQLIGTELALRGNAWPGIGLRGTLPPMKYPVAANYGPQPASSWHCQGI